MPKRYLIALPLLLVSAGLVFGQGAQTGTQGQTGQAPPVRTGSIDGTVILTTSQTTMPYEVFVMAKESEQRIASTFTSLSGHYHFANIPSGNYDVVVRLEGFEEERQPVQLFANSTAIVNMILTTQASTSVKYIPLDSNVVDIAELTRKYPKQAVQDYQKAVDSRRKGDIAKAMELLAGVEKLSPTFSDAYVLLGAIYQDMDKFREAEKQYNLYRDLNPRSVAPQVRLARLYIQEAEANEKEGPFVTGVMYDDALHMLQDAGRKEPRNATIHYLLGVIFYKARSYSIAEASFYQSLVLDPLHVGARVGLANVYIRQRKWKEALDQIDTYLDDFPKGSERSQMESIRTKVLQQL